MAKFEGRPARRSVVRRRTPWRAPGVVAAKLYVVALPERVELRRGAEAARAPAARAA